MGGRETITRTSYGVPMRRGNGDSTAHSRRWRTPRGGREKRTLIRIVDKSNIFLAHEAYTRAGSVMRPLQFVLALA
jgi:hypothetical protein